MKFTIDFETLSLFDSFCFAVIFRPQVIQQKYLSIGTSWFEHVLCRYMIWIWI